MKVSKYQKEYTIKSYESDCHGFLRLLSLMNILQDIATENADVLGLGLEYCLKHNLAWVGSNYLIQINRMPKTHEHFKIISWPSETKLWGAIRDFIVYDDNGETIIKATSQWVLIDVEKRRPVMLKKYFPDYETLDERVIDVEFAKAPMVCVNKPSTLFKVRFDDIDINNHVNNSIYPLWASESVDNQFRRENVPAEIEIWFKQEAFLGETIEVQTQQSGQESLHAVYNRETKEELAVCRIKWRKITSE